MKLKVDRREFEITMRAWDAENEEWTPDFFHDVETAYVDGEEISFFCFCQMLDYWEEAVKAYNEHDMSSALLDPYDHEGNEDQLAMFPEIILNIK